MNKFRRLSARNLALGYIVLSIVMLALFAAPLWYTWRQNVEEVRAEILKEETQHFADIFAKNGVDALAAAIDARFGQQHTGTLILLLTDPWGSRLAGNLNDWPAGVPRSPGTYTLNLDSGNRAIRAVAVRAALPSGYNLLVARDTTRLRPLETRFWYGLLAAGSAVLLVGAVGGWVIRRALLSEVNRMSQTASAIVEGDLSRRLPIQGGTNELDMLAQVVNRMLDQIEQLIHGVRNVSNAIAHDLRTPLAELRARLEELSLIRPAPEETFAEIETAVADVDRVISIFNALLRLAEIDTGTRRSGFVQTNITEVTAEAVEFYQPVAEMNGIALSFASASAFMAAGDPLLLAQAIGNLIDNALKYAQKRGTITVETAQRADGNIEIVVADDGPGIPEREKSRVLERFYRADASRGTPGVGLGLSLVAAVAKLHGGALALTDNRPGLRATLLLPGAKAFVDSTQTEPLPN